LPLFLFTLLHPFTGKLLSFGYLLGGHELLDVIEGHSLEVSVPMEGIVPVKSSITSCLSTMDYLNILPTFFLRPSNFWRAEMNVESRLLK